MSQESKTQSNEKAKTQSIHPLLAFLLSMSFGYSEGDELSKSKVARIAYSIASDAEGLLYAMSELHFGQVDRLNEVDNPEDDYVQLGIQDARSKLKIIKELMFFVMCDSESDYALLKEHEKTMQKNNRSKPATSTASD